MATASRPTDGTASKKSILPPEDWRCEQITEYTREYPIYRIYAEALRLVLGHLCERVAPLAIVQARAKTVSSFAEKIIRKWPHRNDPIRQFTDLCGARVITLTQTERDLVRELVESRFQVLEAEDASMRLGAKEFGYGSVHYIVVPRKEAFAGVSLPTDCSNVDALMERLDQRRAEIQVRTLMQHAWSEIAHDRLYKPRVKMPQAWEHAGARQAALLEQADREFSRMVDELDSFLEHHDAYMKPEEIDREIATLSVVLDSEPEQKNKIPLALKIARLCRQRRAWQTLIDRVSVYARVAEPPETDTAREILVELGRALCAMHPAGSTGHRDGLRHLEAVGQSAAVDLHSAAALGIRPDPVRAAALAELAAVLEQAGGLTSRTRDLRQMATAFDPANPYHLIAAAQTEVLWQHDLLALRSLAPQVQGAARTCQAHAELGIELPRAYFGRARCHLFLQQYYESLAAYAKAAEKSDLEGVLEELKAIERLQGVLGSPPRELEWIARFLRLASLGKLWQEADTERGRAQVADKAEEQAAAQAAADAKQNRAREEAQTLDIPGVPREPIQLPVVIVAGGTDPTVRNLVEEYRERLAKAFNRFTGTVISGGTRAGIADLVGDVATHQPDLTAIGYLPRNLPHDGPRDDRYTRLYESDGESFSPIEPLQCWAHLLASGIRPAEVRVLGINGGRIAAFEYELALALGATVGLVEGSGRAATDLLLDVEFWPPGRCVRLPDDELALLAFISPGPPRLEGDRLDTAARKAHDIYLEQARSARLAGELEPWETLSEDFRESNRQQVLYAVEILVRHGYRVGELRPGHVDPTLSPAEVERMAAEEHGRWVIERLRAGWRYAEGRDRERKLSPYLAGWDRLPEDVKDYDRTAVRNYPSILRAAGLGIYRNEE